MSFKLTGFDKLQRQLRDLERRAKNLHGENAVPFDELFNPSFMSRNTQHSTISAFLEASGFKVESQADFEAIPADEFDQFVRTNSRFSSWEEMLQEAGQEWIKGKLGL